jgi:glutaconyl-CoA/methylmalonyl-CoA decarboxylase subunit gamma
MKKFMFKIEGNQYDVDIKSIDENIAEVEVNGIIYQVEIDKKVQTTKTPKLIRSFAEPSTDISKSVQKTAGPAAPKGVGHIKSPLPGTIVSIAVKEGDMVKIGDRLLILEAMKMENNINSDKQGKIVSIKIKPGDSVLEGDELIEIGE